MATFTDLDAMLQGRNWERRKLGNHTYAHRFSSRQIGIKLHNTYVLIYNSDGRVTVNTGGWWTVTTRARINEFAPYGFTVRQQQHRWGWYNGGQYVGPFQEYDTLMSNGRLVRGNGETAAPHVELAKPRAARPKQRAFDETRATHISGRTFTFGAPKLEG